jgi:putative glutamine amidotransferase
MPMSREDQPQAEGAKLRVGVPYRTRKEEVKRENGKHRLYLQAVEEAGAEAVPISLALSPAELAAQARTLDAVVLPGSPADVHPLRYGAQAHAECGLSDPQREQTDFALLDHAFAEGKPVLAICYGVQSLNVYLRGTLVQDIPSEVRTTIHHEWAGREEGAPEPFHAVSIEAGSRLAQLAGAAEAEVNSSHHQAILEPGRSLRITARAPDDVIEAVEWTGAGSNWVMGVQWHPERMMRDALARALFRQLIEAAQRAHVRG